MADGMETIVSKRGQAGFQQNLELAQGLYLSLSNVRNRVLSPETESRKMTQPQQ